MVSNTEQLDYFFSHCIDITTIPKDTIKPTRWFCSIPVSVFIKFLYGNTGGGCVPEIQREIDNEHVADLNEKFDKHYNQFGFYDFDVIYICYLNGNFNVINGQHRSKIIYDLYHNQGKLENTYVQVKCYYVESEKEMERIWTEVNGSKPVNILKTVNQTKTINNFKKYITNNYSCYIKNTKNPHPPCMNIDRMMEVLEPHIEELNDNVNLIEEFNELNKFYCSNIKIKYGEWNFFKAPELYCKAQRFQATNPLFVTIYKNFEWIHYMIYKIKTGTSYYNIKHYPYSYREKIPKRIRERVWEKRNGDTRTGDCVVCSETIRYDDFECGHILAAAFGGKINVENLEPICRMCNRDMGTQNLLNYFNT